MKSKTKRWVACALIACSALASMHSFSAPAGQDHPLIGRYEGAELVGYFAKDYDEVEVIAAPIIGPLRGPDAPGWQKLEGKIQLYYYRLPEGRSSLEVLRNYESSLHAKGFESIFTCATSDSSCYAKRAGHGVTTAPYDFANALDSSPELPRYKGDYIRNYFGTNARYLFARLEQGGKSVYASIALAEGNRESLAIVRVIETKSMDSGKIAFVGANEMHAAIAQTGSVSLYGILFDFDKDIVKPESKPTLDEIAKLLSADQGLRLAIVGHTDARGGSDYNQNLSQRRAHAVAEALSRDYGITPDRLQARGAGATQPIATNDSEDGRARNRRVELVRL